MLVPNRIWDEARRWFDFWLKGEKGNGIDRDPAVSYYQPWDGRMVTCDEWPPENVRDVSYYMRGQHPDAINSGSLATEPPGDHEAAELFLNNTVSNLQSSGAPVLRWNVVKNMPIPGVPFSIPGDSIAFTGRPLERELEIVGAPRVSLHMTSSTRECQVNGLLYDVSPRGFCRLVTHCAAMRDDMVPDAIEEFYFDLIACAHRFPVGHSVRLVICASDPLYVFPSLVPSSYRLFHTAENPSCLTLPVAQGA